MIPTDLEIFSSLCQTLLLDTRIHLSSAYGNPGPARVLVGVNAHTRLFTFKKWPEWVGGLSCGAAE